MDVRPILLSFQTAIIAILFTFILGTGVAYIVFRLKNRKLKISFTADCFWFFSLNYFWCSATSGPVFT